MWIILITRVPIIVDGVPITVRANVNPTASVYAGADYQVCSLSPLRLRAQ